MMETATAVQRLLIIDDMQQVLDAYKALLNPDFNDMGMAKLENLADEILNTRP